MELKSLFLRPLPQGVIERLHRMRLQATALRYSNDLIRLGQLFKTDKWGEHWYLRHYETHFRSIRGKRLNLLEIGVGGYGDTTKGGDSLRMWKIVVGRGVIMMFTYTSYILTVNQVP